MMADEHPARSQDLFLARSQVSTSQWSSVMAYESTLRTWPKSTPEVETPPAGP